MVIWCRTRCPHVTPVWPFVEVKGNEGTSERQANVRASRERQNRELGRVGQNKGMSEQENDKARANVRQGLNWQSIIRTRERQSKGERQNRDLTGKASLEQENDKARANVRTGTKLAKHH